MLTWILVCDACRAVLYSAEKREDDWQVIGSYSHPESRLKSSELSPTEPGHSMKTKGGSHRTVMQSSTSPKEAEKERFAKQLADVVNDGARKQSYEGLVLVAPPHFAGILGRHLSAQSMTRLKATVHKEYTFADAREARQLLEEAVFSPSSH